MSLQNCGKYLDGVAPMTSFRIPRSLSTPSPAQARDFAAVPVCIQPVSNTPGPGTHHLRLGNRVRQDALSFQRTIAMEWRPNQQKFMTLRILSYANLSLGGDPSTTHGDFGLSHEDSEDERAGAGVRARVSVRVRVSVSGLSCVL